MLLQTSLLGVSCVPSRISARSMRLGTSNNVHGLYFNIWIQFQLGSGHNSQELIFGGVLFSCCYLTGKCVCLMMLRSLTRTDDIEFADTPTVERHLVGSSPLLQCVVSGLPKPEVSWRFNRQRINTGTSHSHAVINRRYSVVNVVKMYTR